MTARPPTTAKSTLPFASATNNFPYWERLSVCSGEGVMADDGFEESAKIFQLPQAIRSRQISPHLLADGLLRIGLRVHGSRYTEKRLLSRVSFLSAGVTSAGGFHS